MQNRNSLWLNLIIMWSLTSHFTSQESALSSDRWTSSSAIGAESVLNGPSNGLTRAAASGQANVGRPLSLSALSIHPEHWADSEPRRGSHQGPPQGSGCIGNCQSQLLPCQSPDGKLVRWSYLVPFPWKLPNSIYFSSSHSNLSRFSINVTPVETAFPGRCQQP